MRLGEDSAPDAEVTWDLDRTLDGDNATTALRTSFAAAAENQQAEPDLGDEAYWGTLYTSDWTCHLSVRDGNLVVSVRLGAAYPSSTCRPKTIDVAKATLAVMPRDP